MTPSDPPGYNAALSFDCYSKTWEVSLAPHFEAGVVVAKAHQTIFSALVAAVVELQKQEQGHDR